MVGMWEDPGGVDKAGEARRLLGLPEPSKQNPLVSVGTGVDVHDSELDDETSSSSRRYWASFCFPSLPLA